MLFFTQARYTALETAVIIFTTYKTSVLLPWMSGAIRNFLASSSTSGDDANMYEFK
jgi:hypothetical protein